MTSVSVDGEVSGASNKAIFFFVVLCLLCFFEVSGVAVVKGVPKDADES